MYTGPEPRQLNVYTSIEQGNTAATGIAHPHADGRYVEAAAPANTTIH